MAEDKYGFVVPCDNCILKMAKELKLKEMRIKEQHDRIKELEDACDDEAERCAKTNDARLAAERELEAEKSRAETIRKEAQDWKRRAEEWQNCYINCGVSRDKALMEIDELKKKLESVSRELNSSKKRVIAAEEEAAKWKHEYYDLFQRVTNRHSKLNVHGITTTPVFDPEYYTPGKLLKVERFYANEKLAETVNVVIMSLDRQNTCLICRTMDKDNEEVVINVGRVVDGTKNGIVLTPIKVVEENENG